MGKTQNWLWRKDLLEQGLRKWFSYYYRPTLTRFGTYGWIYNWIGNERWTPARDWSGQTASTAQPLRPWAVGGDFAMGHAGLARSAKGLTFVTIDGAGHMPKETLGLVQWWLSGEGF
ncbi:hypothetical protein B0H13DRAFT_1878664 [Mycena leptocephala]|nr:hypothetical protein B0H13DRAFT_1878664 [Mycena leptocephala]